MTKYLIQKDANNTKNISLNKNNETISLPVQNWSDLRQDSAWKLWPRRLSRILHHNSSNKRFSSISAHLIKLQSLNLLPQLRLMVRKDLMYRCHITTLKAGQIVMQIMRYAIRMIVFSIQELLISVTLWHLNIILRLRSLYVILRLMGWIKYYQSIMRKHLLIIR